MDIIFRLSQNIKGFYDINKTKEFFEVEVTYLLIQDSHQRKHKNN